MWSYLAERLAALASRTECKGTDVNEDTLNRALLNELEAPAGDRPFYFQREPGERSPRHSPDFDVRLRDGQVFLLFGRSYASRERFLALEAKRLPAPTRSREREYLVGRMGGLERFKRGLHAPDLPEVGMIGYLQENDAAWWQVKLNTWIENLLSAGDPELRWDDRDHLAPDPSLSVPSVTAFRSSTLRPRDGSRLDVRHLWVQLAAP